MKKLYALLIVAVSISSFADEPQPYFLPAEMPNAFFFIPAPPLTNEMRFAYDTAQYQWGKSIRHTPRGEKAKEDARCTIERMSEIFSPILGVEISQSNTPQIWKLLTDATRTANFACDSAKNVYNRKRPYTIYNEQTLVPNEESLLQDNGSYPSGHTSFGWTAALVLCEINPAVQNALLKEGYEYGQSRVIAGFHWQSDVDAARLVASAAFARLHTSKAFVKQLQKAKREYRKKNHL